MSDAKQQVANLLAADPFVQSLGIELVYAEPGSVRLRMSVKPEHMNFMGWAHGGVIFSFADTAFGLASNSRDKASVGIDAHIAYLSGVREGDVIEASATEISRTKRKAVYRVDVTRPKDAKAIIAFTGTVYVTDDPLGMPG